MSDPLKLRLDEKAPPRNFERVPLRAPVVKPAVPKSSPVIPQPVAVKLVEKLTIVRVKRKRDDEPLADLVLQPIMQNTKRISVSSMMKEMSTLGLQSQPSTADAAPQAKPLSQPLVFTLLGSMSKTQMQESPLSIQEQIEEAKTKRALHLGKQGVRESSGSDNKQQQAKEARLKQIRSVRGVDALAKHFRVVDFDTSDQTATEENEVYDLYYLNERATEDDLREHTVIRFESTRWDAFAEYDSDPDTHDSEDSNAESNSDNTYPSTEEEEEDNDSDDSWEREEKQSKRMQSVIKNEEYGSSAEEYESDDDELELYDGGVAGKVKQAAVQQYAYDAEFDGSDQEEQRDWIGEIIRNTRLKSRTDFE